MFHMLTCFNLKEGSHIQSFEKDLKAYASHMIENGLTEELGPIGKRVTDTILDTDLERKHTHFFLMKFADRAQSDRAVAYIEGLSEPANTLHVTAYAHVVDPIFICWEDLT